MDAAIAVVGVATMGSMTCWQLARRGVPVIGFEQCGRELVTLNGGLMIGDPDGEFLSSIRAHDLPHHVLDAGLAESRYPQHRLRPGEAMILDHQAGFVRPELATAPAALRCEEAGGRVIRRDPFVHIAPDADGVTVETSTRTWRVGQVIVTASTASTR